MNEHEDECMDELCSETPKEDCAADFRTMPIDPNRPFLEQLEERALWDEACLKWLEENVYSNLELMREWDPVSVAMAQASARSKRQRSPAAEAKSPPPQNQPPSAPQASLRGALLELTLMVMRGEITREEADRRIVAFKREVALEHERQTKPSRRPQ